LEKKPGVGGNGTLEGGSCVKGQTLLGAQPPSYGKFIRTGLVVEESYPGLRKIKGSRVSKKGGNPLRTRQEEAGKFLTLVKARPTTDLPKKRNRRGRRIYKLKKE